MLFKSWRSTAPAGESDKVTAEDFEYSLLLGAGSFGRVHKVIHKETGEVYAMKLLERESVESQKIMRYVKAERNVMTLVRHPYIVPLRYAFQTQRHLVLVMQYCAGGSLGGLLKKEQRINVELARHFTAQVLLALVHLHTHRILHRDLKVENVLLDDQRQAMVTDFGLAKEEAIGVAGSFLGSVECMAPEVLERRGHNHTLDIYCLGNLLYTMLVGATPFWNQSRQRMWNDIRKSPLVIPGHVPPTASAAIHAMMCREPKNRVGAKDTADVKAHAFFKDLDFEALMRRELPAPIPEEKAEEAPSQIAPAEEPTVQRRCTARRLGGLRGLFRSNRESASASPRLQTQVARPRAATQLPESPEAARERANSLSRANSVSSRGSRTTRRTDLVHRNEVFGRELPVMRVLHCLHPRLGSSAPVDGWDYTDNAWTSNWTEGQSPEDDEEDTEEPRAGSAFHYHDSVPIALESDVDSADLDSRRPSQSPEEPEVEYVDPEAEALARGTGSPEGSCPAASAKEPLDFVDPEAEASASKGKAEEDDQAASRLLRWRSHGELACEDGQPAPRPLRWRSHGELACEVPLLHEAWEAEAPSAGAADKAAQAPTAG